MIPAAVAIEACPKYKKGRAAVEAAVKRVPSAHPQLSNRRLLYILFVTALW